MSNLQPTGNDKTANLLQLLESVQQEIPDELITEIAETIVSHFKINNETSFLLGAVGEEMMQIAYRYERPTPGCQSQTAEQFVSRLKISAALSAKTFQCS